MGCCFVGTVHYVLWWGIILNINEFPHLLSFNILILCVTLIEITVSKVSLVYRSFTKIFVWALSLVILILTWLQLGSFKILLRSNPRGPSHQVVPLLCEGDGVITQWMRCPQKGKCQEGLSIFSKVLLINPI